MTDSEIRDALKTYKRIAVVGLSPKPERTSFGVTKYMQRHGYEITGVNPGGHGQILDRPCFDDLKSVPGPLEIVNVFRRSEDIPPVIDAVLEELDRRGPKDGPKMVWIQLGISHPEAENRARERGLLVVSDMCILQEHARLL